MDPAALHESLIDRALESGTFARAEPRPVLLHPDPLLSKPSAEIDPCSPAAIAAARALIMTMRSSRGCVGLSAPQLGELSRIFCVDVTGHRKAKSCAGPVVLVNPKVLKRSGNVMMREGCASVPWLTGDVARAAEVEVEGYLPGTGDRIELAADAIEARCILHEIDHLDGVLFFERVLDPTAELFVRRR